MQFLGVLLALLLAACNAGTGADAGAGGDLTLSIATPADDDEVVAPIEIQLESSVPLGAPETGNHHVHLYFDTDISSAEYQMVYGDSAEVDRELTPGEHTLIASLRNADHSDAGPSHSISVMVTGEGGVESAPEPTDAGFDDY